MCGTTLAVVTQLGTLPLSATARVAPRPRTLPRDSLLANLQQVGGRLHSTAPSSFVLGDSGPASAAAFFIVFSSVDRIIAATGFVRRLAGSQRRGSAVSRAPYSPLPGGLQEHPRARNSSVC
jgi:hypothetical protein